MDRYSKVILIGLLMRMEMLCDFFYSQNMSFSQYFDVQSKYTWGENNEGLKNLMSSKDPFFFHSPNCMENEHYPYIFILPIFNSVYLKCRDMNLLLS